MTSGEILESLWAMLNEAAYITRTMTLAHRAEMMDACIADINWKKLQGTGMSLNVVLTPCHRLISAQYPI